MPTLSRTAFATVTGLWGAALIRGADGKMRALKLGDVVQQGDVILTSQDGIVQLTDQGGERRVVHAVAPNALDRVIDALNRGDDPDAAPAAGVAAGEGGELTPGLRVERIAEGLAATTPLTTTGIERTAAPAMSGDPADGIVPSPVAVSTAISAVEEGSAVSLGLAAPPNTASTARVSIDAVPAIGQIVRADGTVVIAGSTIAPSDLAGLRYVPPGEYDGVTPVGSFAYTLDSNGATTRGTTTITLAPINDAPVATGGATSGTEDAALPVALGLSGSDVDGSVASVTVTALPAGGTLLLADGVTPVVAGQALTPSQAASLLYRPAADYHGATMLTYTVTDDAGSVSSPAQFRITITPVDDAPIAAPDTATTTEDAPRSGNVLANDSDVDGPALAVTQYTAAGTPHLAGTPAVLPGVGTLVVAADGSYTFTPEPDFNGPLPVVSYVVSDGTSTSTSTLTLSVTPEPDAPFAGDDIAATDEDTPLVLAPGALLANDGDADGDALTIASVQDAINGTVALVGGNILFTPAPDYNGPASFTYTVSDGYGGTSTATVQVDVRPVVDPAISIGDVVVDEAAGTATFTVSLSQSTTATVSVDYSSANGSATAGSDYTGVAGTLTFAPGVTSQTITVPIADDAIYEVPEDLVVTLSAPVNATIADGSATGTITDNDAPALAVSSPTVAEGGGYAVFTVSLSNPSTQGTTVSLSPTAGTAAGGTDYSAALEISTDGGTTWAAASSATIAAGSTGVLVRAPIVGDTLDESDETFTLTATRTSGTTSNASATGTATITDDDATPTLAISDVTVNEGAGTATFTVTLNTASGLPVTVDFASANGSATAGSDYTAVGGTLSFAPGVTSQTITVPIANDALYEGSEDFTVALSAPTNATITDGNGTGTIVDDGSGTGGSDDDRPVVTSVTSPTVVEGGNLDFTITLSNASTTSTVVIEGSVGGSAAVGVDVAAVPLVSFDGGSTFAPAPGGSVSVPAGLTTFIVRLPTIDDGVGEPAETITGTAATAANAAPVAGTGTILDNDTPVVSISGPVTYNEAAGTATYTVTLTNPATTPVSVNYATVAGNATPGVDYVANVGTLTFAPGVTSQSVTVTINDDAVYEGPETFSVTLSAPTGATLGTATSTTTIVDDGSGSGGSNSDVPRVIAVGAAAATEGGSLDFGVTLDNASTTPTTVSLALTSGTATVGTDTGAALVSFDGGATFSPVGGASVSVPAGVTSFIVRVPAVDDTTGEPTEGFTLSASTPANLAPITGAGSITDNDTPALTVSSPTLAENGGFAVFTVGLTHPSSTATTFSLAVANGTATGGGTDYGAGGATNLQVSTNGGTTWTNATSATIAAGGTSVLVRTPIANDAIDELDETFTLTATRTAGTTSNASATGTATITDNDPAPTLTVSSPSVAENVAGGFAQFTVALSNPSSAPVTLGLALANGTATGGGADYGSAGPTDLQVSTNGGTTWTSASSVTIAAGSTSVLVRTPIVNDALDEANETFTLTAMRTAGTTANASATGTATINDNDPTPSLRINDVTVDEAAGTATFTVTLSAASGRAVTVNYATADNTARAASDYSAISGTLSFAPGVTSRTVTVPIVDDATYEPAERFRVVLSGATNASIADGTGVATIAAHDAPTLAVSGPTVAENAGFAVFTVTLSNPSSTATRVSLALSNGTATGGGTDYGAAGATNLQVSTNGGTTWTNATSAIFSAGATSVLVRTPIANDALPEAGETFTLTATRTAGTTSNASAAGIATIVDNDGAPSLTIGDVTVDEAAGTATFSVTLSAASGLPVTVGFATSNGTASAGTDYSAMSGIVNFAPGVTSQTITVPILNDAVTEASEAFTVTLSAPTNATIADGSAVGTITDNDAGPALDLDANNSSGATGANFATTYVENAAGVRIVDTDVAVSDADSSVLAGATVTLTNAQPGDVLAAGAMPAGITATVVGSTVTLAGAASASAYQTALQAITFANGSNTPSTTARTITVTVTDGAQTSNVATTTVAVTAVNDAPTAVDDVAMTTEDTVLSIPRSTLTANDSDPEANALTITSVQGAVNGSVALVGANVVFTPAAHYNGPASFTYTVSDGNGSTSTATVDVTVVAAADAPTLTVDAAAPVVVFENSWESVTNGDDTSEEVNAATLEGWTRIDSPQGQGGGTNRFEVWTTGDEQENEDGDMNTVAASPGNGQNFLELNDSATIVQTIGINRSVATAAGLVYQLSLDYAGRPGFNANHTRIGIYLDGVLIQQYAATSPQGSIDWDNLKFSFQGDGGTHTLMIRTDATEFNGAGRGALIDDLRLTATQGVVAGNSGATTTIALATYVTAALVDADGSEGLTLAFSGVPDGATIVTAGNPGGYAAAGGTITIPGAELSTAQLRLGGGVTGHLSIGVTASGIEASNGSTASTGDTLEIDVVPRFVSADLAGDGLNQIIGSSGDNTGSLNGTGGADYIVGLDGDDRVNGNSGSNGNDVLDGGDGADTLRGGAGNDVLYGGSGVDTLVGGTGADTFAWTLTDRGTPGAAPTDTITDFASGAGGDVLDLRDLLVGEHSSNLADYLHFTTSGSAPTSTTTISISSNGGFAGGYAAGAVDQVIQITGVNLVGSMSSDAQVIADLISRGKLMVDNG